MLNVQCNNWSTPTGLDSSRTSQNLDSVHFSLVMMLTCKLVSTSQAIYEWISNAWLILGFGLCQVFTLSLAALGSLMWLRKNKPSTLVPFIYASAGVVATMPTITRSASSLNPSTLFLCDYDHLISKYQMNSYTHIDWNMHQLHLCYMIIVFQNLDPLAEYEKPKIG